MKASVEIQAVDGVVNGLIEAAMVEALSKNADTVIRSIVLSVLTSKPERYSEETLVKKALRDGIRQQVEIRVARWIESHDKEIEELVNAELAALLTPAFVAEQLIYGLKSMHGSISFKKVSKSGDDE